MISGAQGAGRNIRAGDALIAVKKLLPHGEFKVWVERNCECSYRQAMKYMAVAKRAGKVASQGNFEGGIDAFLDATAERRKAPSEPNFDRDDAERVKKLHALALRGA